MKVNTKVLVSAEDEFKKSQKRVATINDEIESVISVIYTIKDIDEIGYKLKKIIADLEKTEINLSRMSCLLEMAAKTYNKSEEAIEESSIKARRNPASYSSDSWVKSEVDYIKFISLKPDRKIYNINNPQIADALIETRKNYYANSFAGIGNGEMKTYNMRFGSQASVISTIGKI